MPLSSVLGAQSLVRPGVCTSTTRPASPFEGQTVYETDTDRLATWDGSAWVAYVRQTAGKVLQVLQTTKTDVFTTTSTTYTDVTGLSRVITPSATSSRVLIIAQVAATTTWGTGTSTNIQLAGGNSGTYVGDAAGNRVRSALTGSPTTGSYGLTALPYQTIVYLDSPATTSAITYKVQVRTGSAGTLYVNRSADDLDSAQFGRFASSITVMEISG